MRSLAVALLFISALALPAIVPGFTLHVLCTAMIAAVAVLGLNFAFGWAGLISLAQAGFMGIGAYATAILTTRHAIPIWVAAPIAIAIAGIIAIAVGLPMLRLRGHYLALATLGFNVSFHIVASGWESFLGGTDGIGSIPAPTVFGHSFDTTQTYFYVLWAALAVAVAVAARLRVSHVGRSMIAVRDDEIAAGAASIDVVRVKVQAFALGACYAGAAGVLFAHFARYVAPEDFNLSQSILFLAMLIIGGEGSIVGSVLGAVLVTLLPELLRFLGQGYLTFFGILMLVVLIFLPKGLVSLLVWRISRRQR
jgi:branched-chain amino acid transport system permease protein